MVPLWMAGDGTARTVAEYVLMYARDNAATATDGQELPSGEQIEASVTALRMLADPTRLRLLWLLREGEHDVGSLAAAVGAGRPAVSQHLGKLLLAGLVSTRRDGRRALYRAKGGHVRRLVTEVLHAADHHLSGAAEHD
jgi:DNA-binding transcriptional ArsR family regulator